MFITEIFLQDSNSQVCTSQLEILNVLLLQGQGVVGVLSRDLPSAPGSHINGGDVFFKATVENIHIFYV